MIVQTASIANNNTGWYCGEKQMNIAIMSLQRIVIRVNNERRRSIDSFGDFACFFKECTTYSSMMTFTYSSMMTFTYSSMMTFTYSSMMTFAQKIEKVADRFPVYQNSMLLLQNFSKLEDNFLTQGSLIDCKVV